MISEGEADVGQRLLKGPIYEYVPNYSHAEHARNISNAKLHCCQ
jgi:hypothetical protein